MALTGPAFVAFVPLRRIFFFRCWALFPEPDVKCYTLYRHWLKKLPLRQHLYRASPAERRVINEQVSDMLCRKVI